MGTAAALRGHIRPRVRTPSPCALTSPKSPPSGKDCLPHPPRKSIGRTVFPSIPDTLLGTAPLHETFPDLYAEAEIILILKTRRGEIRSGYTIFSRAASTNHLRSGWNGTRNIIHRGESSPHLPSTPYQGENHASAHAWQAISRVQTADCAASRGRKVANALDVRPDRSPRLEAVLMAERADGGRQLFAAWRGIRVLRYARCLKTLLEDSVMRVERFRLQRTEPVGAKALQRR